METNITMAEKETDSNGFTFINNSSTNKKARTDQEAYPTGQHEHEMAIRITFYHPPKTSTPFNVAANVNDFFTTMSKEDEMLHVMAIDQTTFYHPKYDKFPFKEAVFKTFFEVHPRSTKPSLKNTVTVGCTVCSNKTILDIKFNEGRENVFFTWLKEKWIFVKSDTLGHSTTRTFGFLFHAHPHLTHRTTLRETFIDELQCIKITPTEVIALEPHARKHYENAMESGDETPYIPPFELFTTEVIYGPTGQRVKTPAIGLQCKTENINLIRELFTRLFNNPPPDIAYLQYTPSGLQSIIGDSNYRQMLLENNKYLDSISTIPIEDIDDDTLDLTITPPNAKTKEDQISIRNIFLSNPWCLQVEPTQTPGRILLVTTKGQLATARKWLNDNLAPLFTEFLPRNAAYTPNKNNAVPSRTDLLKHTQAMMTYAQSLLRKYNVSPYNPTQTNDPKYAKPPASTKWVAKLTYDKQNFPPLPKTNKKNPDTQTVISHNSDETNTHKNTSDTHTQEQTPINLAAIQKDIECSLREDFQQLINQEIGPLRQEVQNTTAEFKTTTTELRQQIDQMAKTVELLHKQNAQILASLHQMNKPTPVMPGAGQH